MRVFVTGATGFIGSAVVSELIGHGHDFHQFSHAGPATRLRVVLGGSPREVVSRFLRNTLDTDRAAITTSGEALAPGRPFVAIVGTLGPTAGRLGTENDEVDPNAVGGPRDATEQADDLAARGVRAPLVRLPPIVHGDGDHGFLPQLISFARKDGVSGYAGDGGRWPSVHRRDAARLLVRALEEGRAGTHDHGVADEGAPFIDIPTSIDRHLGLPVVTATPEQVRKRFSFLASFIGTDNPTSSALTTERLGWNPAEVSVLDGIDHGTYFATTAA